MTDWIVAVGGLLLSVSTFILGKNFAETERILADKRRIYEEFLRILPRPNEAYIVTDQDMIAIQHRIEAAFPTLLFYASPAVTFAVSEYLVAFEAAAEVLTPDSPPMHESYRRAAKSHNDIILEMRRDAFSWSFFAHRGKSRLPQDALERARENSL